MVVVLSFLGHNLKPVNSTWLESESKIRLGWGIVTTYRFFVVHSRGVWSLKFLTPTPLLLRLNILRSDLDTF